MTTPFVSIIVPAYNAQRTMSLCIESLLAVNYPKDRLEIIIVDNNSTDQTADIIKQYPVTYMLEDEIQTSYAARNRAIRHAKGEILAFTDSDCIADPDWIQEGVKPFSDPSVVGVSGNVHSYKPEHYIERYQDRKKLFDRGSVMSDEALARKRAVIITANAFYRRDLFDRIGMFEHRYTGGGDKEFSFRIQHGNHGKLVYRPQAIVYHKHRTTLVSFWEQYFRYGYNAYHNAQKYNPNHLETNIAYGWLRPVYWQLREILKMIGKMIRHLTAFILTRNLEHKENCTDWFLNAVQQTATLCGLIRTSIKTGKPFFDFPSNLHEMRGKIRTKF